MIKTNIIEPGAIVEFIMVGDCELEEVLSTISSQYRNISTGVLWNFTSGSNVNLSAGDMTRIAEMARKHAVHKKTAYVVSLDVEYGMLRMYEVYAETESVPTAIKVFRDRDTAIQWLKSA